MKGYREIPGSGYLADVESAVDSGCCAIPGCPQAGEYRAPRSRDALRDYIWLCLDHVRAYNASWDYYAGMGEVDIEAHRWADVTWRRPTWPLGAGGRGADGFSPRIRDAFGLFDDDQPGAGAANGTGNGADRPFGSPPSEEQEALAILDLAPPVTLAAVKARYKELVKRLHPDANGGDKEAEERLKSINQAYSTLTRSDPLVREMG